MKKRIRSIMIESLNEDSYVIIPSDSLEKCIRFKCKLESRNSRRRKSILLQKKNNSRVERNFKKIYHNRRIIDKFNYSFYSNNNVVIVPHSAIDDIIRNSKNKRNIKNQYNLTEHDGKGKLPPIDE